MKKISNVLLTIFAVGVILALFAGGLSLIGYIIAMFIGGETATTLCVFIKNEYLPWVIRFTSIFTGIGLIGMYFSKQKALTVASENVENASK